MKKSMGDLVLGTEVRYLPSCKNGPIVGDDGMRKFDIAHDVLPKEFDNLLPRDIGERYCFHLLSE